MLEAQQARVFRYAWSQTAKVTISVGLLITLFSLTGGYWISRGRVLDGSIIIIAFGFLFGGLLVLYRLAFSAIRISETQVAAVAFGIRWRSLAWREVTKIRRVRDLETDTNEWHMLYYIQGSKPRSFLGQIMFQDRISELRSLLDLLNEIAAKRQIPIVSIDHEADVDRAQRRKASWLRSIFPEELERPIEKL